MNEPTTDISLLAAIAKGGWAMAPLFLCSIIALGVIIERVIWGPTERKVIPREFVDQIRVLLRNRQFDSALQLARVTDAPIARVFVALLTHLHMTRAEVFEAVQVVGRREAQRMQKYLGALSTVAAVGPLLGLLGTVVGMITMFSALGLHGVQGSAAEISVGISEALIATATGLGVAVPSLVLYRFFLYRARVLIGKMEAIAYEVVDELTTSRPTSQAPQPGPIVHLQEAQRS